MPDRRLAESDEHSSLSLGAFRITDEPYYRPQANEIEAFAAAARQRLPVMLKGPTGCGKTRFIEYMAWRSGRPLISIACHEDLAASDLVGRYLLDADGTVWHDGPLTQAVRYGAICYLDEVVEARPDSTVVIHPLTDARRILPLEKTNELVAAHADFQLVISFNPGYQSVLKDLKESSKQRFVALEFNYPDPQQEAAIVAHEGGVGPAIAECLVEFAHRSRELSGHGLEEGASTRMLIHTALLLTEGVELADACQMGVIVGLTDDNELRAALTAAAEACFG